MKRFWSIINTLARGMMIVIIPVWLGIIQSKCIDNILYSILFMLMFIGYSYMVGKTFINRKEN